MNSDKRLQLKTYANLYKLLVRKFHKRNIKSFSFSALLHLKDFALYFVSTRHLPSGVKTTIFFLSEIYADKKQNHTKIPFLHNMTSLECQNTVLLFLCCM